MCVGGGDPQKPRQTKILLRGGQVAVTTETKICKYYDFWTPLTQCLEVWSTETKTNENSAHELLTRKISSAICNVTMVLDLADTRWLNSQSPHMGGLDQVSARIHMLMIKAIKNIMSLFSSIITWQEQFIWMLLIKPPCYWSDSRWILLIYTCT